MNILPNYTVSFIIGIGYIAGDLVFKPAAAVKGKRNYFLIAVLPFESVKIN